MLTLKRLPVYTRIDGILCITHSNVGFFSTRQSHAFSAPSSRRQQTLGSHRTNQSCVSSPRGASTIRSVA